MDGVVFRNNEAQCVLPNYISGATNCTESDLQRRRISTTKKDYILHEASIEDEFEMGYANYQVSTPIWEVTTCTASVVGFELE